MATRTRRLLVQSAVDIHNSQASFQHIIIDVTFLTLPLESFINAIDTAGCDFNEVINEVIHQMLVSHIRWVRMYQES